MCKRRGIHPSSLQWRSPSLPVSLTLTRRMLRLAKNHLRKLSPSLISRPHHSPLKTLVDYPNPQRDRFARRISNSASSPSLSIWRRKKEMGKEGLMVAKELKRLQSNPVRFDRFIKSHVSRLLKSDLVAVLAEFQRQDLVSLSMKVRMLHVQLFSPSPVWLLAICLFAVKM